MTHVMIQSLSGQTIPSSVPTSNFLLKDKQFQIFIFDILFAKRLKNMMMHM
uniref:Uncharacterized protein n=1 Tax=Arundo donax TaxID=35708 RepID=A0A0A9FKW2_ARUDO